jgi:hypothetical protein
LPLPSAFGLSAFVVVEVVVGAVVLVVLDVVVLDDVVVVASVVEVVDAVVVVVVGAASSSAELAETTKPVTSEARPTATRSRRYRTPPVCLGEAADRSAHTSMAVATPGGRPPSSKVRKALPSSVDPCQ